MKSPDSYLESNQLDRCALNNGMIPQYTSNVVSGKLEVAPELSK